MKRRRRIVRLLMTLVLAGVVGAVVLLFLLRETDDGTTRPAVATTMAELPASSLSIPVVYDTRPLLRELEAAVPIGIGSLSDHQPHPTEEGLRYAFEAQREPFEAEVRGDVIHLTTVIQYGGQVWYATPFGVELTAGCGTSEEVGEGLRAAVSFSAPLEIDEDWRLRSRVSVDSVAPLTERDRCTLSVFQLRMDVTEAIMTAAQGWLQEELQEVDRTLAALDLRPYLEEYWGAISAPIPMGPDLWLTLNPSSVRYRTLNGGEHGTGEIHGEIGLTASPRLVMGARPESTATPLPPLESGLGAAAPEIVMDTHVTYASLTVMASRSLAGEEFRAAGRTLEVKEVEVGPADAGRVAVSLSVDGGVRGWVHLVGTPVYDPETEEVTIPDLEFTVETEDVLARAAAWVIRGWFPGSVRERMRWPVGRLIEENAQLPVGRMTVRLADEAHLDGRLGGFRVEEIVSTGDALVVRSRMEADASLRIGEE